MGEDRQDLVGGQRAQARPSGDQARGHVLDDRCDLGLERRGGLGEADNPLAEPGQRMAGDPGQPVRRSRAGQGGAGPARALRPRWRSCLRSSSDAVTMTEVSAVREVLADCTALSRSAIGVGHGPCVACAGGQFLAQQDPFPAKADLRIEADRISVRRQSGPNKT